MRRVSLLALLILSAGACRREEPAAESPAPTPEASATESPATAPVAGTTVSGHVRIDGTPPPHVTRVVKADPELCGSEPVVDRDMLVDPLTKGVRFAVVTLTNDTAGHAVPAPVSRSVEQAKCEYFPYVTVVPPGSRVTVTNADEGLHDVHVMPESGTQPAANHSLRADGRVELSFPETGHVRLGCDLHYWARAWVIVNRAPFAAVTDADGRYAFEGVPAGEWRLTVWHERLGTSVREVTVRESGPTVEDFALPSPAPSRAVRP